MTAGRDRQREMNVRATIFCNHYRAMSEHDSCKAGVVYETLNGVPFKSRPCFWRNGKSPNAGCGLAQFPTAEELAEEERETAALFAKIVAARNAITEHLGPWKKGTPGAGGRIDCPACGGKETLSFSRAGYNGHVHARCATDDCVSWME